MNNKNKYAKDYKINFNTKISMKERYEIIIIYIYYKSY